MVCINWIRGESGAQDQNQSSRGQEIQSDGQRQGQEKQRLQEPSAFEQKQEAEEKAKAVNAGIGGGGKKYPEVDTVQVAKYRFDREADKLERSYVSAKSQRRE
jgi:hypothetical protein